MAGTTKLMTAGGGGVSLTPASSIASDVTVNVPSQNCTLGIQGPAFSAYKNADQPISQATWTKIQINTETFDTNSNFDTSTYRFTPTVAGYYQFNGHVYLNATTSNVSNAAISLYKNGSAYKDGVMINLPSGTSATAVNVNALIYLNGSTDYVELWGWGYSPSGTLSFGGYSVSADYFDACLARAA